MVKHWFGMVIIILAVIVVLILFIIKNSKDRKNLFRKLPGDLPDPEMVESEFDKKEHQEKPQNEKKSKTNS
jgi:hypothetical protein